VKADQLSQLMSRPLGLKGVTNPLPAEGGDDAETLADARRSAPLTVMTLGRVVSLRDYEDFARAFAGVGKALATWTWDGERRGVFLTVAGADGADVPEGSELMKNLLAAMRAAGDAGVPLTVASYGPRLFRLKAKVKVGDDYVTEKVLAEVERALRAHFSFDARDFGQPVTLGEVLAVMQTVEGTVAVDVDELYRVGDEDSGPQVRLPAAVPSAASAAELLTLDPAPLKLEVMP
jgi:predicted phage baseplate assembly protein